MDRTGTIVYQVDSRCEKNVNLVYIQSGIRNEPMSSNLPALRKGSAKHEGQSPAEVPRLDRTSLWESAEVFCRNKDTSLQKHIAQFSGCISICVYRRATIQGSHQPLTYEKGQQDTQNTLMS